MLKERKVESITLKFLLIFFFVGLIAFNVIYFKTKAKVFTLKQETAEVKVESGITKKIWQTAPKDHEDHIHDLMSGWKNIPGWEYNFMNDEEVKIHLNKSYPNIDFDKVLEQRAILAYDLFRYSIIHKEGGLYADSDVEKASEFEDSMSKLSGCNVIVGIEADVRDRGDWWKGKMARKLQLVQWSFYSAAKHPLMEFVVDRVVRKIEQLQADGLNLHDQNVMDVTGPGIWTDSINDYIRLKSGVKIDEQMKCGSSYRYNDICILNVKGYALSMPHSCGNETDADTFIIDIHHFLGSWKHD